MTDETSDLDRRQMMALALGTAMLGGMAISDDAKAGALERLPENSQKLTIDVDTEDGCGQITHVA